MITFETTMGEILAAHPAAKVGLFHRYHIGGCSACGYDAAETLAAVRERNGIKDSLEQIVACIESSAAVESRLHAGIDEVAAALERGDEVHLIDVRSPEEYDAEHLAGARLLTVNLTFEVLDAWEKDAPIVVYSNDGKRSLDKASYLTAYGKTNAKCLDGGLTAWKQRFGSLEVPGPTRDPQSTIVRLNPPN
jgi:rhodanese-related sulfurtransferase